MIQLILKSSDINWDLPITASEEYLQSISNKYGWFVSDIFILPYIIEKKGLIKRMVFTHETICMKVDQYSIESEKSFLNDVVSVAREMKIDLIYQPHTNAVFATVPDGAIYAPFGTYQVDLTKSEEELFNNLHVKHRNAVRKAQKDGIVIRHGSEFLILCANIMKETMSRQGLPYISVQNLKKMTKSLKHEIDFYVAFKDGVPQGCALLIYRKNDTCYYLHGGSIIKPSTGSLNLLHWVAMLDMKNKGVQVYDFVGARINPKEGSKLESIQRFKERFGSKLKEGYLWKYPLRCNKYRLFYLFALIYYFIKGMKYEGDIIDQEIRRR